MKKKIINGILLVALVFAASSAFVSCKDNDSDVKTDLLGKIASLQAQIDALKPGIPGADGQDGKNGIDGQNGKDGQTPFIGANGNWWIGDTDTGVQAKGKNGEDGQNGKNGENGKDGNTPEIGDNGNWWIGGIDTGVPASGSYDDTDIWNKIKELEAAIKELQGNEWATQDDIDKIQKQIDALSERINAIFKTQVTSLNIDAIKNPLFGFVSAPVDVQTNILVACFGKATTDVEFPQGSGQYIADAGETLIGGTGNAGTIYVTVNPSSVDFAGKTLTLENTAGVAAPVTLSPLENTNEVLMFGGTRASSTGFYKASATITKNVINDVAINLTKSDLRDMKDDVITMIKKRTKRSMVEVAKDMYAIYEKNPLQAYRLKATWGDNYNTFSETKIAAISVKPLSYSFDPEGAITTEDLQKLENEIYGTFNSDGTLYQTDEENFSVIVDEGSDVKNAIISFCDVFNKYADIALNNVNYLLQPTLLVKHGNKISRTKGAYSGKVTLLPTSRSAELFAPAYKKYVDIKENGVRLSGENLDKVIDGSVDRIYLELKPGKRYDIEYQAVDFKGVVRVRHYVIFGK